MSWAKLMASLNIQPIFVTAPVVERLTVVRRVAPINMLFIFVTAPV